METLNNPLLLIGGFACFVFALEFLLERLLKMNSIYEISRESEMLNRLKEAQRMIEQVKYTHRFSWAGVRMGKALKELKDCINDIESEMRCERNALFKTRRS